MRRLGLPAAAQRSAPSRDWRRAVNTKEVDAREAPAN
jgi:hypothetical protein